MGASVDLGAHAVSRHLKVLLSSSTQKLRISGELARRLDSDDGFGGMAMLVSPLGSKVWPVEVGQDDGDGVVLGRGWPEFVAAHGIGALWFLVFRYEGRGVLTVKAFDTSLCLHEFTRPLNAAAVNRSDTAGRSRRPQFIKVLLRGITEKMVIPAEFVRNHITKVVTNSPLAVLLNLCGKYWCVEAEKDRSGNVFFSGGWSRFLASNGITEGDALVLRYEGNLLFTVKAFGVDGCQKSFNSTKISGLPHIEETDQMKMNEETDAPSSSTGKRMSRNEVPSIAEPKRPASSSIPSKKRTAAATSTSVSTYDIGPPSWIRKRINASTLQNHLALAYTFCKSIGFSKHCEIMLRTTTGNGATRSWKVRGQAYSSYRHYQFGKGWTSFCRDNKLKEGDVCTFNVIETKLWDVDISRCS